MVKPVISNSAAGTPHPDDPNLTIPQVMMVSQGGVPAYGGSRVYGRDTNGRIITEDITYNGINYRKTYTRNTAGKIINETDWVQQ